MAENPLVTTGWLAERLGDDNLRIVDIRGKVLPASEPPPHYFAHRADYETSHIPGAVFVDWTQDIVDPDSPSLDIISPEQFASLMSKLGIGDGHTVVACDDAQGMFAARFWWAMTHYGHKKTYVLDGGWNKWIADGLPTTAEKPVYPPAQFTIRPDTTIHAHAGHIHQAMDAGVVVLDVRSAKEFKGDASRANRSGRIPGSVNLPRKQMITEQGHLLPLDILYDRLAEQGVENTNQKVIVYCNSGVSASYGMLALRMLGFENVAVYDGSWKDWANNPEYPIETS